MGRATIDSMIWYIQQLREMGLSDTHDVFYVAYIQSNALHLRMHCIALPQVYMSLALSIVQHQKWLWLNTRVAALGRALTTIRAESFLPFSNSGNWCLQCGVRCWAC